MEIIEGLHNFGCWDVMCGGWLTQPTLLNVGNTFSQRKKLMLERSRMLGPCYITSARRLIKQRKKTMPRTWRTGGGARHCILVLITTLKCTYSDIPRLAHTHTHSRFRWTAGHTSWICRPSYPLCIQHFVIVITTASDWRFQFKKKIKIQIHLKSKETRTYVYLWRCNFV